MIKALDNAVPFSLPCVAHTLQLVVNEGRLAQRSVAHSEAVGAQAGYYSFLNITLSLLAPLQEST